MSKLQTIPRTLANKLLTLAQQSTENEVCGLISRSDSNQFHIYPVNNVATDQTCVFEMEPSEQIHAFKDMRERNESLFAIFHSHPKTEAIPSRKDLQDAAYEEALNIIISLGTEGVLDMRGYYYKDDYAEAVDLVIE